MLQPRRLQLPAGLGLPLNNTLSEALDAFYATLDKVTLASLVEGNEGLKALNGNDLKPPEPQKKNEIPNLA